MAGSYNHVITDQGNLRGNDSFTQSIENLGDAYEAIEEMYGMIWWLAYLGQDAGPMPPEDLVKMARESYHIGLELAKGNENKGKHHGS